MATKKTAKKAARTAASKGKATMTTMTAKKTAKKAAADAPKPRTRNRPGGMEGTRWTSEDYRKAGYTIVSTRLGPEPTEHLRWLQEALGAGPTEVIRQAIGALRKALEGKQARRA